MQIPNKSQFKLDEVSSITGVKSYVLRFWESEFEQINPTISSTGQKLYDHHDVEVVALLKKLLFEDKMTIEQAKQELDSLQRVVNSVKLENTEEKSTTEDSRDKEDSIPSAVERDSYVLSKSEMQKIVLAKAKLESLLSLLNELKIQ